jgi:hypothetical protein
MTFYEVYKSGYLLRIKLSPGASSCEFRDVFNDEKGVCYLKTSVNAVAEKGKANKELIKFLAASLKIAKSSITVISGTTDHLKKIFIDVPQTEEFCRKLSALKKEKTKDDRIID